MKFKIILIVMVVRNLIKQTRKIIFFNVLLSVSQLVNANLVTNGSFELGTFIPTTGDFVMSLPNSSMAMTGWTVINDSLAWARMPNPFSLSASDGDFFLDLTDAEQTPAFGGVSQMVSTEVGKTYLLSFDLGSSNTFGRPNSISVSAGSTTQLFTGSLMGGNSDWERFVLPFTASSSSTVISLTGAAGRSYIGLDNVSVSAVPLPASAWLFITSLLGLWGITRKRVNLG